MSQDKNIIIICPSPHFHVSKFNSNFKANLKCHLSHDSFPNFLLREVTYLFKKSSHPQYFNLVTFII